MFCKECGHEIKEGNIFCTNCGTKINEDIKRKNINEKVIKIKLSYLIIVAIIVIAVVIGIILTSTNNKNNTKISENNKNLISESNTENEDEIKLGDNTVSIKEEITTGEEDIDFDSEDFMEVIRNVYPFEYDNICTDGDNYWIFDKDGRKIYFSDLETFKIALQKSHGEEESSSESTDTNNSNSNNSNTNNNSSNKGKNITIKSSTNEEFEKPINNFMEAAITGDSQKFLSIFPPVLANAVKGEITDEYLKEMIGDFFDDIEGNINITYEVISKTKLSASELEELEEEIYQIYKITKGYKVEIGNINGFSQLNDSSSLKCTVCYLDGDWYILDFDD